MIKIIQTEQIKIWLYNFNPEEKKVISNKEEYIAQNLSKYKSQQFKFSRGCIRESLSNLFNVNPLLIPLNAPPGNMPLLDEGWGHISLSHCKDVVLIAWSSDIIGIDIERKDRNFKYEKIFKRILSPSELKEYSNLRGKERKDKILELWVKKEAIYKYESLYKYKKYEGFKSKILKENLFTKSKLSEAFSKIFNYQSWIISIVSKSNHLNNDLIICY